MIFVKHRKYWKFWSCSGKETEMFAKYCWDKRTRKECCKCVFNYETDTYSKNRIDLIGGRFVYLLKEVDL